MRHFHAGLLVLLVGLGTAAAAQAGRGKAKLTQVKFAGVHPIPKSAGGGLCHIEAPHVHVYAPADVKVQYRVHDDHHVFVGDPVAYGWDGPRHAYYGHHPVHVEVLAGDDDDDRHVEYCYLDGAHYHHVAPPPDLRFELSAGAYWYVGELPETYVSARPTYDPIDVVYEPIVYERPVVVVDAAPQAWVGFSVAVAAPVVEIEAPRARPRPARVRAGVEVVAPSLSIEVGVPAIVVDTHVHGGVVVHGHGHGTYKKHKKFKKHKKHKRGGRVRVRSHR